MKIVSEARATKRKGRTTIFISLFIAVISMFIGWAKLFIFTKTGFDLEITLIFIFWSYPVFIATFNLPMSVKWGGRFALANIIAAIIVMMNIAKKHIFGFSVDIDIGAWIYFISSLLLCIGIVRYKTSTQIIEKLVEEETIHPVVNIQKPINKPKDSMLTTLKNTFTDIFNSSSKKPEESPYKMDSSEFSEQGSADRFINKFEALVTHVSKFDLKVNSLQDQFTNSRNVFNELKEQLNDSNVIFKKLKTENDNLINRLDLMQIKLLKLSNQLFITLIIIIMSLGVVIWRLS